MWWDTVATGPWPQAHSHWCREYIPKASWTLKGPFGVQISPNVKALSLSYDHTVTFLKEKESMPKWMKRIKWQFY